MRRATFHLRVFLSLPLLLTAACIKQELKSAEIHWTSARFNERLRADLEPLHPEDLTADLERGFFRDGSDGGLVSPLFPLAASRPEGLGNLVQTSCLFVGEERDAAGARVAADELRIAWEVAANIDRGYAPFGELFVEGREELGLCSFSNPQSRLLFEDPSRPIRSQGSNWCGWGRNDGSGFFGALTLNPTDWPSNRNIPIYCGVPVGFYDVAVDAFPAVTQDADGRCPAGEPTIVPVRLDESLASGGPALRGDRFAGCALPAVGVVPTADTTYRLSLHDDAPFGSSRPERWLRPDILTVPGRRKIVRPLAALPSGRYSWSTKVEPESGEGPVRWGENFTPTVRVEQVEIVSRSAASGADERVERPSSDRLVLTIPRSGGGEDIVACTGRQRGGVFTFAIDPSSGSSDCAFDGSGMRALTPTYLLADLDLDLAVTRPIRWEASLPGLAAGRELYIRFQLVARSRMAGLKSTAHHPFGRIQLGEGAQAELTLENIGGRPLEVQSIGFDSGSHHPQDFSFLVAGEPVAVPLPVVGLPASGGSSLAWSRDAGEQDVLRLDEQGDSVVVSFGDPRRGTATEPIELYGEQARLVGGQLLREDRAARFDLAPGGESRPFALVAEALLEPPFVLVPGARVTLAVTARPLAPGQRSARIAAKAIDPTQPSSPLTAVATVSVEGVSGPQLHWLPETLWLKREVGDAWHEPSRWLLLENVGASPLTVTSWSLSGVGAGRFLLTGENGAPPFTLASGGSSRVLLTYRPTCDGEYGLPDDAASVQIVSNGGSATVPVFGLSEGYCELP